MTPPRSMSPTSTTGRSAAAAKPILAMSPWRRLISAALPAPSTRTMSASAARRSNASSTRGSSCGFSDWYSCAEALAKMRPMTTICAPRSDCGFSSTGFMSLVGATRQARACSACARPISPPSWVTAALFDMFCGLNGRTARPRRVSARPSPATSSDLPTSEPVPCSISAGVRLRFITPSPLAGEGRGGGARAAGRYPSPSRPSAGSLSLPQGERAYTSHRAIEFSSELDAGLRLDAAAEGVLHQRHLGHEVGDLDQLGLGVAAGDDDVQVARLGFQRLDHLLDRQVVVA